MRYRAASEALTALGYDSTLDYLAAMADLVFTETGLLPHLNPGLMDLDDLKRLRAVSVSMGIMLESDSEKLLERGGAHFGSPDKAPQARIDCMEAAGEAAVPFTSGILIGIGETREDRISSRCACASCNDRHGHIQEIIVQNFRAKPDTKMRDWPEPTLEDLLWTIAAARLIFGPEMHIQAPPNLSPGVLPQLVGAGIDDWGGVSPVTPDFVNPEAPWPHLDKLADETLKAGKHLVQRLPLYQDYALKPDLWLDKRFVKPVLDRIDGHGLVRDDHWSPGEHDAIPGLPNIAPSDRLSPIIDRAVKGERLDEADVLRLFQARGGDFRAIADAADALRRRVNGERSAMSSRGISTTPTSATSNASSVPSRRASCRRTCAGGPMT